MKMELLENYFATEDEAVEEIKSLGFYPLTVDLPADSSGPHWHDFDSIIYVVKGEVQVTETGVIHTCTKGSRLSSPAFVIHSEMTKGYRTVAGLSQNPDTLTQPINKPSPVQKG